MNKEKNENQEEILKVVILKISNLLKIIVLKLNLMRLLRQNKISQDKE